MVCRDRTAPQSPGPRRERYGVTSRCIRSCGGRRWISAAGIAFGPVEPGPRMGAAQPGDLVPQHEQLRLLRCRGMAEQDQPAAEPGENEIQQAQGLGSS